MDARGFIERLRLSRDYRGQIAAVRCLEERPTLIYILDFDLNGKPHHERREHTAPFRRHPLVEDVVLQITFGVRQLPTAQVSLNAVVKGS